MIDARMTTNEEDTRAVVTAARHSSTPLIEGWMYRCHPQIAGAQDILRRGEIGTVEHIEATFTFESDVPPDHRLRNPALGGGAILDIGGYPMSIAMALARLERAFARVHTLDAQASFDTTGVDASASADVMFESGVSARLHVSICEPPCMHVIVRGSEGSLSLPAPFLPESQRLGLQGRVEIDRSGEIESHLFEAPADCFSLEARAMGGLIQQGIIEPPAPMVGHDESIAIASALDLWRTKAGAQQT